MRCEEDELQGAVGGEFEEQAYEATPVSRNVPNINTNCIEEFPTLNGEAPAPILGPLSKQNSRKVAVNNGGVTIRTVRQSQPLAVTDENFPALGPDNTTGGCKTVRLSVNSVAQDRPSSGASGSQKPPANVSIHVNHRPSGSSQNIRIRPASQFHDDFPTLSSSKGSAPSSSVQWLGNQSGNGTKTKIQAPPSQLQPPKTFKTQEDFPSLSSKFNSGCSVASSTTLSSARVDSKSKKASSLMIPVTSSWTQESSRTHESWSDIGTVGKSSDDSNTISSSGNIKMKLKKKKNKSLSSHNTNSSSNDTGSLAKQTSKDSNANESGKKKKKQVNAESEGHKKFNAESQKKGNDIEDRENEKPPDNNTTTHERKRSELLIAALTSQQPTENKNNKENSADTNNRFSEETYPPFNKEVLDDFPSITGSGSLPPGFEIPISRGKPKSAPPPGFGGSGSTTSPPPGFSVTLNSVARPQSNGLTFTNSSGQSYSILPGRSGNTNYSFVQPHDFSHRNQALVTRVKKLLNDSRSMDDFCQISKLFRQGEISASDFYSRCLETMGPESFAHIFPELLVLLPDIEKQQVRYQYSTKVIYFRRTILITFREFCNSYVL